MIYIVIKKVANIEFLILMERLKCQDMISTKDKERWILVKVLRNLGLGIFYFIVTIILALVASTCNILGLFLFAAFYILQGRLLVVCSW